VNDKNVYPYRNLALLLRKKIDFYSKLIIVHTAEIVDPFFGPIFPIKIKQMTLDPDKRDETHCTPYVGC
jgi:hypothetical protein